MILPAPVGFYTPLQAQLILPALHKAQQEAVKRARAKNEPPSPELRELFALVADVRKLAEHYQRTTSSDVDHVASTRSSDADVTAIGEIEPNGRTMTPEEVAGWVDGITAHGVREAVRRGRLPARRVSRHLEIDPADVAAWAARRSA